MNLLGTKVQNYADIMYLVLQGPAPVAEWSHACHSLIDDPNTTAWVFKFQSGHKGKLPLT